MKIKKAYAYMGSKGRFYKEIKEIFKSNYRDKFIDLFGGGMEVPLNLKEDFSELDVLVNIKDERLEAMLETDSYKLFESVAKEVYQDMELSSSRRIYQEDKELFNKLKVNFLKSLDKYSVREQLIIKLLGGVAGKSKSLSSNFYSEQKMENLRLYFDRLKNIKIQTEFFDESWKYKDSFIFLDPPYLTSTKSDNKKGYNYENNWSEKDDVRLLNFIKKNLGKNNIFMIFGSVGNHLQTILKKEFSEIEFHTITYKKSIFGCSSVREEWYCLIK